MIDAARIGVSTQRVTVLAAAWPFGRRRKLIGEHAVQSAASPLQEAVASLRRCGSRAHVILADAWVRYFMVTPPDAARRLDDCRAAAALRFTQLHEDTPDGWEIRADWRADRPFLACALPVALLDHLQRAAADAGLTLLSVRPQFIAAFNGGRPRERSDSWLAVAHDHRLTLGAMHEGRLRAVRSLPLPETRLLSEVLRREALRLRVPVPGRLRWLGDVAAEAGGPLALLDMRAGQPAAGAGVILATTGAR